MSAVAPRELEASSLVPERLNLAIGKRCFVSCRGCYSFFGEREPDLQRLHASVAQFVTLGVADVTLAGGDPLTIRGLLPFLAKLRSAGVRSIKLDTVGSALLETSASGPVWVDRPAVARLLEAVDYLSIPLDGWSNPSVGLFRSGRPRLYDETVALLSALDAHTPTPRIVINTVIHAMNSAGVDLIAAEVLRHPSVCHWNVFQYMTTDQAPDRANAAFAIDVEKFLAAERASKSVWDRRVALSHKTEVEFRSGASRLGRYFLVNSDGTAWIPDQKGDTIVFGTIFGREDEVLRAWRDAVLNFRTACHRPPMTAARHHPEAAG